MSPGNLLIPQGAGGGSNSVKTLGFSFAYNLPDLASGVAFYTPTVGDLLLDAWVEILTGWDGTAPSGSGWSFTGPAGDIGQFVGGDTGLFAAASTWALSSPTTQGCLDMGVADTALDGAPAAANCPGLLGYGNAGLRQVAGVQDVSDGLVVDGSPPVFSSTALVFDDGISFSQSPVRFVPSRFTSNQPLKVVVSADGTVGGADPGSSRGSAIVFLRIETPTVTAVT